MNARREPLWALALLITLGGCGASPESRRPLAASSSAPRTKQLLPPWTSAASVQPEPSGPGRRVLETARRMYDEGTVVRGSCYRYVDTVFGEAGYDGWRRRTNVFRGRTSGPYANLDLVQPGDWLWIVNHPELSPVGTHSVIFVAWEDRANGYASVYSYVGGGQERSADLVTYDVSRTYAIQRAVEPEPAQVRRATPRRARQRARTRRGGR